MREYNNYPRNIENNNNITTEVKKPKLYLVTSKIVNLFAIFVASVSVSTFFATRYIGLGDIFFSANIFSTMFAVAIFIVILENYGRKNAIKAFMGGAYAILLVFFISAFITDFNPTPIGYYQSSFINFHQIVLLSVFVSYIFSFLVCIKVYLYMKDDLTLPYVWAKAIPSIALSQIVYTVCYYLIYHGFSNLELVSLAVKSELYLKFFMMIASVLVIYFIISGIKSGFFDLFKNAFGSKNIRYIDTYEHNPIKSYEEEDERSLELPYNKPMSLGSSYNSRRTEPKSEDFNSDYRNEYHPKRNQKYISDYSEDQRDSNIDEDYKSEYEHIVKELVPQLKRSRISEETHSLHQEDDSLVNTNRASNRSSGSRRTSRRASTRNSRGENVRVENPRVGFQNIPAQNQGQPQEEMEDFQEDFQEIFQDEGQAPLNRPTGNNSGISRNRARSGRPTPLRDNQTAQSSAMGSRTPQRPAQRPVAQGVSAQPIQNQGVPRIAGISQPNTRKPISLGASGFAPNNARKPNQAKRPSPSFGSNNQAGRPNASRPNQFGTTQFGSTLGAKPKVNSINQNQRAPQGNSFGNNNGNNNFGNNNTFGAKPMQQNQSSFFASKLSSNSKPSIGNMGGFNTNMNKNNTWNKR